MDGITDRKCAKLAIGGERNYYSNCEKNAKERGFERHKKGQI